ncbi:Anion exchange protein 3 [Sparganum proliferum]
MTEESGHSEQPMASMFIELCQLTDGVPWSLRGQQAPTSWSRRYWHERYRWVEMEEAFDTAVGEFSPPEVPNFTYEEINAFKSRVKKDLVFQLSHKHTIEAVFENLPTISTAAETIQRTDTENYTDSGYFIPFFHPQLTNSGKSPVRMPKPLDPSISFEFASSKGKLKSWTSRCCHRLCPPLRDLALGLVDLVKRYPSDFKDAFSKGNASVAFGSILFVYFVIFSPAITFGTLMGRQVDPAYTVSNSILTSGITTLLHSLFAGQPIGIIGPSGPGFIMEKIIAKYIPQTLPPLNTTLGDSGEAVWHKAAESGVDVFIALLMVCFSLTVVRFKGSHLVRRRVRFWVGAMNVPLGMIAMSAVNRIFFWAYEISRLRIPPANHLNYSSWFNVPDFSQMTNYGTASASYAQGRAAIFGLILGFLIFVEIALNGIVPLRGMSTKPSPIVVDHVLANIVYPILALFLGLPIMSGVPIRTIANMVALAKMEPHPAPGRPPKVLYLVETRVNTAIVGVLIIISVFLGNILQYIPVAALLGLFLFLGIFGMKGLRFRKLITATFSRRKYWCEWNVLDGMPRPQVIVFTGIWVSELMLLYTLLILGEYENLMMASTAIPFFMVFCAVLRNLILPRWKWMAPYLEKIDPPCVPDMKTKTA